MYQLMQQVLMALRSNSKVTIFLMLGNARWKLQLSTIAVKIGLTCLGERGIDAHLSR